MGTDPRPKKPPGEAAATPTVDLPRDQSATPSTADAAPDAGRSGDGVLPAALDRLCDEFDAAWRSGPAPRIEEFLSRADTTSPAPLLRHLLAIEIFYRMAAGQSLSSEEYERRFPNHVALVREVIAKGLRNRGDQGERGEPGDPTATTAAPVRRLLGDYEIFEKLGGGGMGVVYKARHRRLQRWVALKQLHPGHFGDAEALRRFAREIEAIGRLNHPNLVQCTDAREEAGVQFLVMEYIEGRDLSAIVGQHGPLSVPDACEIVRQVALGLQHIHQQGLVHRDIKPSNVMLTRQGVVKILDLGLSRLRGEAVSEPSLTASGQVMGTPDYMAPEQVSDASHVDIRADLYALGCTLYYLLAGGPPYGPPKHLTLAAKLVAHASEPFPELEAVRGDIPAALSELIAALVAKSPADRIQDPGAVLAACAAPLCDGANLPGLLPPDDTAVQPANIPPPSASRRPGRWRRLGRRWRWLVAGGLLLAGLAAAVVLMVWNPFSKPAVEPVAVERSTLFVRRDGNDETIERYTLIDGRPSDPAGLRPLGPRDDFKFHAELNRPSNWCLVWIDTKGLIEIACQSEKPEKTVEYPPGLDKLVSVNPDDPAGLHLLLLVVSNRSSSDTAAELQQSLADVGRPRTAPDQRPSLALSRGSGSVHTTTANLDPDYFQRVEEKLPREVRWVHQLYLPTQR